MTTAYQQDQRQPTPWGISDSHKNISEGIDWFGTPSHGGFRLSAERLAQLPLRFKYFKPWAGAGWFEEDCDWCVVVIAFPGFFSVEDRTNAEKTFMGSLSYFNEHGAVTGDLKGYVIGSVFTAELPVS